MAKSKPSAAIDDFFAKLSAEARPGLEKLRQSIRAAAPKAEEGISYGTAAFKYIGPLVSYGAAKTHLAFYVMSPAVMAKFKDELKSYDTSPGAIRFPFDKTLPAALVKKLVKARIAENEAIDAKRKKPKKS